MNIALFASQYYPHFGGVEELVRQLAIEYRRRGHHAIVVTNRWPRSLPAGEVLDGIPVYRLPLRVPDGSAKAKLNYQLSHALVRRRMLRILRAERVEMLHVQCVSANAFYAMEAKRALGLPLVTTLQGELTMDATQVFERSAFARNTLRAALAESDVVTACSAKTLADAESFLGRPVPVEKRVVFNGAAVEDFSAATPYAHPRPYLFAIGRVVSEKGFDLLLRAYLRAGVASKYDLLLAGDGPELPALKSLAAELGITPSVLFLGRQDRSAVPSFFRGAAVFVLPSRAQEGLPVVCAEAMAAGKPVIATRSGGAPEAILHEETGLVVEREDVEGLALAIRRVCLDEGFRRRCAEAGRRRSSLFGWGQIGGQYLQIYEGVSAIPTQVPLAAIP